VNGPDARLIPWTSITILILLAALVIWLWRVWMRFRRRRLEPMIDEMDADFDEARDRVGGFFGRLFGRDRK